MPFTTFSNTFSYVAVDALDKPSASAATVTVNPRAETFPVTVR